MNVTVKLFATLAKDRFYLEERTYPTGTTGKTIMKQLKINEKDIAIVFINNIHSDLDQPLKDGDTIALFPPIGGG